MSDKAAAGTGLHAPGEVTASDVVSAYRLLFDREPESSEVVANHVARHENLQTFRETIFNSPEFRGKYPRTGRVPGTKPLDWPPIKVDVHVPHEQLAEMIRLIEGNWEMLGQSEPHWSVLTSDQFKSDKIGETEEQFYLSGERSLDCMTAAAARCEIDLSSLAGCLELGCGVGRVTVWLAKRFRVVTGIDISHPHILLAESVARRRGIANINFAHMNSIRALQNLPPFDCLYSVIVLQHNPPPLMYAILDTLLPKLKPGGIAYFQLPTYRLGYKFDADDYLANTEIRGRMELHVLPQPALFSLYAKHRCQVLEVREDNWPGSPTVISNSFLLRKASKPTE
jgi:2-polyprenyl-3-methyl-5-hydroxy-6-metoxy-1,4-benzoquinol methylase